MSQAEIKGHPSVPLLNDVGDVIEMLTVCSECGEMHTILFLDRDRWYCSNCRVSGSTKPKLFPIT